MVDGYIDRNRLLKHLNDWWLTESPTGNEILFINGEPQTTPVMKVIEECMKAVEEQPATDVVEVVHGRWLSAYEYALKIGVTDEERLEEVKKDKWWKFCNNCEQQVKGVRNYCPDCGAKMDGKKVE